MPFELDLTAADLPTPAVATNNMKVLDLDPLSRGSTTFPREIAVQGTGADGALLYATWTGFPALAVDDFVVCWQDDNDTILRVAGAGGGTQSTIDASTVTYTPTTLADWDSSTDPGNTDDALDQLAERTADLEGASVDASTVSYTPSTLGDWDSSADPGNTDDALDQLAERVADNEGAVSSGKPRIDEIRYTFNSTTTYGDPGAGKVAYTTSTGNNICFSDTDVDGTLREWIIAAILSGQVVVIMEEDTGAIVQVYTAASNATDHTGWWHLPVSVNSTVGTLTNGMSVVFGVFGQ